MNQSYEPITICNIKKAMILILLEKAELISDNKKKAIRTVTRSFPCPSVIRLSRYVTVPYKNVVLSRKNIMRRDSYKCLYCGRSDLPLTIDHIIPKAQGGQDTWENLATACTSCNNKKGDRTPEEANMPLIRKAFRPNHIIFIKNSVGRMDENWKQYLYLS